MYKQELKRVTLIWLIKLHYTVHYTATICTATLYLFGIGSHLHSETQCAI